MTANKFNSDWWAAKAALKYAADSVATLGPTDSTIRKAVVYTKVVIKGAQLVEKNYRDTKSRRHTAGDSRCSICNFSRAYPAWFSHSWRRYTAHF